MSKRLNLAAALHDAGAKPAQAAAPVAVAVDEPAAANEPGTSVRPPSRAGQRAVTTYVSPEAHAQLAMLAIERGQQERRKVSTQQLMTDALNDLFKKYGRPPIA